MRVAIATHEGRVSPVLDAARRMLVADIEGPVESNRREVPLAKASLTARVRDIRDAGVVVLICGAVSWPLEAALVSAGVQVIARVCGPIDEVLGAYLTGQLTGDSYLMPGCGDRRRRRRSGRGGRHACANHDVSPDAVESRGRMPTRGDDDIQAGSDASDGLGSM